MNFEPHVWHPPRNRGLKGPFAKNDLLRSAALWDTTGRGPEDVAIDPEGRPVTGLADGRIIRFPATGGPAEEIADVGGRPLGIEIDADGESLIVCNAKLGLQRVTPDGRTQVLADRFGDSVFRLTNNAAVARDGTIYFSVSSHRWGMAEYTTDILERTATGALYRRDTNGELDVVMGGLAFANGVALSSTEDFVLVAELGSYRIHRIWLTTERAGTKDLLCENLPGFPDNLNVGNGLVWCGFPGTRDRVLDAMLPRPRLRALAYRLPARLRPPRPSRHGFVAAFDETGRVLANFQDPTGRVAVTTSAIPHGRYLYVGSLTQPSLAVVALPDSLAA